MTTIAKICSWAWWNIYYTFDRDESTLEKYIKRNSRCWWPWKTFIANAYHCDSMQDWQITLEDVSSYTSTDSTIRVTLSYAQDDGRVVGITIHDEVLLAEAKKNAT